MERMKHLERLETGFVFEISLKGRLIRPGFYAAVSKDTEKFFGSLLI
jgi:hypothetical protein